MPLYRDAPTKIRYFIFFHPKNFLYSLVKQNIKSSAMLDKKEEQLLRITSFYPAKQLFILCFLLWRKRKSFKGKKSNILSLWECPYTKALYGNILLAPLYKTVIIVYKSIIFTF
ncbi:hypothetical protein A7W90_18260 [Clostridium sp. Bc-iso-3]|nr:hypothetical protein A7W90_18425 [Clostridium sp. Bc-iso-3]ODM27990.1 hypothetical protein A7W90_18260 [Clostridium sp. Bc-iso-3]